MQLAWEIEFLQAVIFGPKHYTEEHKFRLILITKYCKFKGTTIATFNKNKNCLHIYTCDGFYL